ncbi:MAG: HAMP domain-containing histidine kinase [Planctomycetes bacterium]|nr:HAMP domain-containing histidine kinase [Planctomycetota bacterium]
MSFHRRRAWAWFVGTAGVLVASLVWMSTAIVGLDRDEVHARQVALAEQKMRLALWRMDSWLSPRLAREAMRPAAEYRAFAPAPEAWTKGFNKIAPDEVLVPSPLLNFESDLFPLHFELADDGAVSSPQVPTGNARDIAEAEGRDGASFEPAAHRLEELRQRLPGADLSADLAAAEARIPVMGCFLTPNDAGPVLQQQVTDYDNRQLANAANQGQVTFNMRSTRGPTPLTGTAPEAIGPMVPMWLPGEDSVLVFVRRVTGNAPRIQGVLVEWSALHAELIALVADLFAPGCVELVRCAAPTLEQQGAMLASVPARLVTRAEASAIVGSFFAGRVLWIVWGGVLLALTALGFTLRAALGFGERRARFASAVTHELRTPLTTFRMYSEMLADGVVTEPAAQKEYLDTLRQEADRLARVVENVLAWSRLEQGRFASRCEPHVLDELIARQQSQLQRRLEDAGMTLVLDVDPACAATEVVTDEDAVAQILFNLVDNAAKYARDAADRSVTLRARADGDRVALTVCDRGPGVPDAFRRRIFAPFDRGAVPTASNEQPGVGLGLALSQGLARDLGGELDLVDTDVGACFRLRLPRR